MQHKITKQYANGVEALIAEFLKRDDAELFIAMAFKQDEQDKKIIYRLFAEDKLQAVFNSENSPPKNERMAYQSEKHKLSSAISEPFNVIIVDVPNPEIILAKFSQITDAKTFIKAKLLADEDKHVDMTYYLFDGDDLIEKSNQNTLNAMKENTKKPRHMIRPSPYIYRLRPRGSAYGSYNTGENEDDEKEKK